MDLTPGGEAARVTEPAILQQMASIYRGIGWPAEAAGDRFTAPDSAPRTGPPPWHLYQFAFHTVIGFEHHRAERRDTRAVQPMTTPSPATTGRGRSHGETLIRLRPAIHLNPGGQGDLARWPIGSHRDLPLPFHADAPHRRVSAREGQRGPDRALLSGPSRSARPPFPV